MVRRLGRRRIRNSFETVVRRLFERAEKRIVSRVREVKRRIARRIYEERAIYRELAAGRLQLPLLRDKPSPRAAEIRRRHRLMYGVGYTVAVVVEYPVRLINHLYCRTARPIYVHAARALTVAVEKIRGLYLAVWNVVWRLRRPMVRARTFHDRDWEEDPGSLRSIATLIKKYAGAAITRIVKLVDRVLHRLAEHPVFKTIKGYFRTISLVEAAVRQSLGERLYAAALGYRERAFLYKSVRHCSFYVYVEGERYTGPPSGWYHWRRRYRLCNTECAMYTSRSRRTVCANMCEQLLAMTEPRHLPAALDYYRPVLREVVESLPAGW